LLPTDYILTVCESHAFETRPPIFLRKPRKMKEAEEELLFSEEIDFLKSDAENESAKTGPRGKKRAMNHEGDDPARDPASARPKKPPAKAIGGKKRKRAEDEPDGENPAAVLDGRASGGKREEPKKRAAGHRKRKEDTEVSSDEDREDERRKRKKNRGKGALHLPKAVSCKPKQQQNRKQTRARTSEARTENAEQTPANAGHGWGPTTRTVCDEENVQKLAYKAYFSWWRVDGDGNRLDYRIQPGDFARLRGEEMLGRLFKIIQDKIGHQTTMYMQLFAHDTCVPGVLHATSRWKTMKKKHEQQLDAKVCVEVADAAADALMQYEPIASEDPAAKTHKMPSRDEAGDGDGVHYVWKGTVAVYEPHDNSVEGSFKVKHAIDLARCSMLNPLYTEVPSHLLPKPEREAQAKTRKLCDEPDGKRAAKRALADAGDVQDERRDEASAPGITSTEQRLQNIENMIEKLSCIFSRAARKNP